MRPPACVALALLFSLPACEKATPLKEGKPLPTTVRRSGSATAKNGAPLPPPSITASIGKVKLNWKDRQQTFTLSLTNHGEQTETVHAIVYAKNDDLTPPRRGVSPPTAFNWFKLANSTDGDLKSIDVARAWKAEAFASARGGRLRKSWDVKIDPEDTAVIDAAHDLDETSPHAQWKGRKLAAVGYSEYQIWLFTDVGDCFLEETVLARPPSYTPEPQKRPEPKVEVKKSPEPEPKPVEPKVEAPAPEPKPKPVDAKTEMHAANELRLAAYYLEVNRRQDAKDKLNLILKKFPDTKAAEKAREMLKNLS
jgi:hypothetical protein